MPAAARQIILVLGVHRSGTSALAQALAAMGCTPGEFPHQASQENPEGFGEHPDFRALNDAVLAALGASWDNWALHADTVAARLPDLAALRAEAVALLAGKFPGAAPIVLKDPRICVLLPFWRAVVADAGLRAGWILALRDPVEVAQSQATRAGAAPDFYALLREDAPMQALWAVTLHGVLRHLPPEGALRVPHADLMTDPAAALRVVAQHFALPVNDASLTVLAQTTILPGLHRERRAAAPPDIDGWPGLAAALFTALVAPGGTRPLLVPEAQAILAGLPDLTRQLAFLPPVASALGSARAALDDGAATIATLRLALNGIDGVLRRHKDIAVLADLDAALAQGPVAAADEPAILLLRAGLAIRLGQLGAAENLLRRLTASNPGHRRGWRLLIDLTERAGNLAGADDLRQQARAHFPDFAGFQGLDRPE